MKFKNSLLDDIGFNLIQDTLASKSRFTDNKQEFLSLKPYENIFDLYQNQNFTQEILDSFIKERNIAVDGCNNIDDLLKSLEIQGTLIEQDDFKELKILFNSLIILKAEIKKDLYPLWEELTKNIYNFKPIIKIFDSIFDNEFNIKSTASKKLLKIREEQKKIDSSMIIAANKILHKAIENNWNMDDRISWKNNRIVIPINHSYKKKINGIVQDISKTGQTVFIEPTQIVNMNNRYNELIYEEKSEIVKILLKLTDNIREIKSDIFESYNIIKKYDYHFSIAKFAYEIDGIKPQINQANEIKLDQVISPLFKITNKDYIPLDIEFGKENLILISGPNAGGKTVVLKTLGLVCFMSQCGLFIPGEEINVPMFDYILSDIGDKQSIENDLSTFSSHISNINNFIEIANKNTLILIDEVGTGTDPQAGIAISMALLQELINKKSLILATTHLGALKIWAEKNKKTINAHMMFDTKNLKSLYSLKIGKPGSSYAIEVLKSLGIKSNIVNRCKELMKKEDLDVEQVLINLQKEYKKQTDINKETEKKLTSINELKIKLAEKEKKIDKEFKKARHDASKEAEHIIKSSRALIEKTIENIKQNNDKDFIKEQRTQVDKKILKLKKHHYSETFKGEKINELKTDMMVFIPHLKSTGKIIEVASNKKNCKVLIGSVKINLNKDQLYVSDTKKEVKHKKTTSYHNIDTSGVFKIDLRGERVDSAIEKVEKFLDKSIITDNKKIFILHGKGTGALITAIHKYLENLQTIDTFYFANPELGGTGVTIVELK